MTGNGYLIEMSSRVVLQQSSMSNQWVSEMPPSCLSVLSKASKHMQFELIRMYMYNKQLHQTGTIYNTDSFLSPYRRMASGAESRPYMDKVSELRKKFLDKHYGKPEYGRQEPVMPSLGKIRRYLWFVKSRSFVKISFQKVSWALQFNTISLEVVYLIYITFKVVLISRECLLAR